MFGAQKKTSLVCYVCH